MHEGPQVLPCKCAVLCQYNTQVDTLLLYIVRLIDLLCRLNVKLGGINAIPEADDVSFLTDSANPTIVMGRASSCGLIQRLIL